VDIKTLASPKLTKDMGDECLLRAMKEGLITEAERQIAFEHGPQLAGRSVFRPLQYPPPPPSSPQPPRVLPCLAPPLSTPPPVNLFCLLSAMTEAFQQKVVGLLFDAKYDAWRARWRNEKSMQPVTNFVKLFDSHWVGIEKAGLALRGTTDQNFPVHFMQISHILWALAILAFPWDQAEKLGYFTVSAKRYGTRLVIPRVRCAALLR